MDMNEELLKLAHLQRHLDERRAVLRAEAIAEAQMLINRFKVKRSDLHFVEPVVKSEPSVYGMTSKIARAVAIKYVGPNGERWAGCGRTPRWLERYEEQGGNREDLLVK